MTGPFVTLTLILLFVGFTLCAAVVMLLARALAIPPRMSDGKAAWVLKRLAPGDLGLPFEDVGFEVQDVSPGNSLKIAAWWISSAQPSTRCVLLLHGYADAKVGSIAWAPMWHGLGWNILTIDLRAHGESGGRFCSGGFFERDDVGQVINLIRTQRTQQTRQLVLFGASFGAAVAVAAAAQRDDIDAVVLDSPVPDFAQGAMLQMARLGAPGGVVRHLAVRLAERMTGARYADVRLLNLLTQLKCAALIIAPEHDPLLDHGVDELLRNAVSVNKSHVFWPVSGAGHLGALAADPAEYQLKIIGFLKGLDDSHRAV